MAPRVNPMARAWLDAAEDLGIRVVHPFSFIVAGRSATTRSVFLPDFGSARGALLLCRFDSDQVRRVAERSKYFRSILNPHMYEPYDRNHYIDTLNDWGWYGDSQARPAWYAGYI